MPTRPVVLPPVETHDWVRENLDAEIEAVRQAERRVDATTRRFTASGESSAFGCHLGVERIAQTVAERIEAKHSHEEILEWVGFHFHFSGLRIRRNAIRSV